MPRPRLATSLFVYMNGLKVGRLTRSATDQLRFEYASEWLDYPSRRPISLSMPLQQSNYTGGVVANYFDNLLPDSMPFRRRIQARFGAQSDDSFDLLSHIGRECVGALQLLPEDVHTLNVQQVTAVPVTDHEIAHILEHYATMPLGISDEDDFRISLAGAQEKTALLWSDGQWHRPMGTTPTTHILKLPIGVIPRNNFDLTDSVENEWLCHAILAAYGLPVAPATIAVFEDTKALIVERFDRRWAEDRSWIIRLPQEDLCQALGRPPALKYESDGGPGIMDIMDLLLGSADSLADRRLFMTTQVLFWLLCAIDGHAKNFSIALQARGDFQLTPLYDVMSAHTLLAKKQLSISRAKMAMALRGKNPHYTWERIKHHHWLETAKRCNFPPANMESVITDALERMDLVIDQVAGQLPTTFPGDVAEAVFNGMRQARDMIVL